MVYSLLCHSFVATEEKNNFIGIHNVTYTHCARLWERDYNKLIRIYRYREKNLSAPIRLCIREDDLLVRLFAFSLKRIYFIVCNVSPFSSSVSAAWRIYANLHELRIVDGITFTLLLPGCRSLSVSLICMCIQVRFVEKGNSINEGKCLVFRTNSDRD